MKPFVTLLFVSMQVALCAQTTVRGRVMDENDTALISANIMIKGTTTGTTTDINGQFTLTTDAAPPFFLMISYTGYAPKEVKVKGNQTDLEIVLTTTGVNIDGGIVISASRKAEKITESPASVSVLLAKSLAVSPDFNPTRTLANLEGVTIQQQSASRVNVEMRGSNNIYATTVFPILDYRNLQGAGTGTFQSSAAGLSMIDLQRIEVVRGPGSALYGAGVTSGVIHYISKNPIDFPGTTVEVIGGELNTIGGAIRHATKVSDKLGFKINAQYRQGNEFTLDPTNSSDSIQIAKMKNTVTLPAIMNNAVDLSKTGEVLIENLDKDDDGNPMPTGWMNAAVNATLEFRPQKDLSVFLSGGLNRYQEIYYNSQGEGWNDNLIYWTQARMQYKGLFAQVFYDYNDGGTKTRPTFLYQTGAANLLSRKSIEGQVQYNFEVKKLFDANFTIGVDYRNARSDSRHLTYGRNEFNDDYNILGSYAQGQFKLLDKLDMVLSGRYDHFNFLDNGAFSPRAALVFKPNTKHTIRASYNKAVNPPSALGMYLDLPVSAPIVGLFDIWGTGSINTQTYADNNMIDLTAPGLPDIPIGTAGLPLELAYGAVNGDVIDELAQAGFSQEILDFLSNYAPTATTGTLRGYDIFTGKPLEAVDNAPVGNQIFNTYEIGYKGLLKDKLRISLDVYYNQITGFRQFGSLGPTYSLSDANVAGDLEADINAALVDYLTSSGANADSATATAAAIATYYGAAGGDFNNSIAPFFSIFGAAEGSVVPQGDGAVHVPAGNRTYADATIGYIGIDFSTKYYFSKDWTGFFNCSYLSQTTWEINIDSTIIPFNLNTPRFKTRLGVEYTPQNGLNGSISYQYTPSYAVSFGQFSGDTDVQHLVDASVGYQFKNGLSISLNATNLFNTKYRFAPNFPQIGRRVLARVIYTFGDK